MMSTGLPQSQNIMNLVSLSKGVDISISNEVGWGFYCGWCRLGIRTSVWNAQVLEGIFVTFNGVWELVAIKYD